MPGPRQGRPVSAETIVALYDTSARAAAAAAELADAGIAPGAITRLARTVAPAGATLPGATLPGDGHDAGATVLTVRAPAGRVRAVTLILERHGAVDIDGRAAPAAAVRAPAGSGLRTLPPVIRAAAAGTMAPPAAARPEADDPAGAAGEGPRAPDAFNQRPRGEQAPGPHLENTMSGFPDRDPAFPGAASFDTSPPPARVRISWGAILGGVVLVVVVQLLLSLLGTGIGLSTVDVQAGTTPDAGSLGLGAGVWWLVSSVVALFVGGFVAARLAGIAPRLDGLLHGLVTWGIATLLTIWLLTSAVGGIIGGGFSALGSLASAAGSGISAAAKPVAQAAGLSPDVVKDQAQAFLQPANPDPATMSPQDAQKEIAKDLATYAKGGPDAAGAKEQVISIIAAQTKVSHDEAARRFDDTQAKLQQAKAQAVQAAKQAADASAAAASKTSFAVFVALLLGGIAGGLGGLAGVTRRTTVAAARRFG